MNNSLIITFLFNILMWFPLTSYEGEPLLIKNMDNIVQIPRNFRVAGSQFMKQSDLKPSTEGFDQLMASASSQFSEVALLTILEEIKHPPLLYIVDLREECHGYLNGTAVSWYVPRNWENVGLSQEEIEETETSRLNQALKNHEAVVHKIIEKDPDGEELPLTSSEVLLVEEAMTEQELCDKYQLGYKRLPITDHTRPKDEIVQEFIEFVRNLPEGAWLHFHCSAGIGRASVLMVMYDIVRNAKQVSYEDIIIRQNLIGGANYYNSKPSKTEWKKKYAEEKVIFLKEFYEYCKNYDYQQMGWQEYLEIVKVGDEELNCIFN